MARPRKWPPTLHHHKSSGQAFVRIKGDNVYLGKYGSVEAATAYGRLVAAGPGAEPPRRKDGAPAPPTVAEVVLAWERQEAPRLSERGRERPQFRLSLSPLLALYGPTPAASFGARELEAVMLATATGSWLTAGQRERRKRHGQPEGCCARTVNHRAGRVRAVWRWAERAGLVPPGSWAALKAAPGLRRNDRRARQPARRQPASWDDLKRVAIAANPSVRAVLLLCWWTGMRPAEAYTMTPGEIDRTGPLWVYRPAKHKTAWLGLTRQVVLNRKAQAVLRPFLKGEPGPDEVLLKPMRRPDGYQSPVYTCPSFCRAVRKARERAGVEGVVAYQCRHSAKDRVTRTQGLDAARALLGQSSVTVTAGYGTAADLELARRAAENLRS